MKYNLTKILEFIITSVVLSEGIFAYLRIRASRRRKKEENNFVTTAKTWYNDLSIEIKNLKKTIDLLNTGHQKEKNIAEAKLSISNLEKIRNCLILLSSDNPIEISNAYYYLKDLIDLKDRIYELSPIIFELFKKRLELFKGREYDLLKKSVNEFLNNYKT